MFLRLKLYLILNIIIPILSKPPCSEILEPDRYQGIYTLTSIFRHVLSQGCFLCTIPDCDFYLVKGCEKKFSSFTMPWYNDLLEFGLVGNHFPNFGKVRIRIKKFCSFLIEIHPDFQSKRIQVTFSECYLNDNKCEIIRSIEYSFNFNNKYCLYMAFAIYEKDKIHFAHSLKCNKFASRYFNASVYLKLITKNCYYLKGYDDLVAKFQFLQDRKRRYDGVPLVLPCSPGGFAVDERTGRFVVGDVCNRLFSHTPMEDVGIYFIIKNIFKNQEDLLFPTRKRLSRDFTPAFINRSGMPFEVTKMAPKHIPNQLVKNRKREGCTYIEKEVMVDVKDKVTTAVTKSPEEKEKIIQDCSEIISLENLKRKDSLSFYIGHTGCYICAEPVCNYSNPECKKEAVSKPIPLYRDIFEFGVSALHFPKKGVTKIKVNSKCYIKVEFYHKPDLKYQVLVEIFECLSSNDKCIKGQRVESVMYFHDSFYCVQIGLSFVQESRIYIAITFDCVRFPAAEFDGSHFMQIRQRECYAKKDSESMSVIFEFLQDETRTSNGIPIILPCSPGGHAVDQKTGRILIDKPCWDMFWDSKTYTGINFLLKNVYMFNEDLLFPMETEFNSTFPVPIYIKSNGEPFERNKMVSDNVTNKKKGTKSRLTCAYVSKSEIPSSEMPDSFPELSRTTPPEISDKNISESETESESSNSRILTNEKNFIYILFLTLFNYVF